MPEEPGVSATNASHSKTQKDIRNNTDETDAEDGSSLPDTAADELPGVERNPSASSRTTYDMQASGKTDEGHVRQAVGREEHEGVADLVTREPEDVRHFLNGKNRSTQPQPGERGEESEGGLPAGWHESEKKRDLQSQGQPHEQNVADEGSSMEPNFGEAFEARNRDRDDERVQERLPFIETARRLPPELHAMLLAELLRANAEPSSPEVGFPASSATATSTSEDFHGSLTAPRREAPSPLSTGRAGAGRAKTASPVETPDSDNYARGGGGTEVSSRSSAAARQTPLPSSATPSYAFHVGAAASSPSLPLSPSSIPPSSGSPSSTGALSALGAPPHVSRQTEVPYLWGAHPDPHEARGGHGRHAGDVPFVSPGISSGYTSQVPSSLPPPPSWPSPSAPSSYVQQLGAGNPPGVLPSPASLSAYSGSPPFPPYSVAYSYPYPQPYSPYHASSLPLSAVLAAAPAPPPVLAETVNAAVGTAVNHAASLVDNTLRSAIVGIINPATYSAASMLHSLQALNDKVYAGSEVATRAFLDFAAYRRSHPDDTLAQFVNSLEEATDTLNEAATAGTPRLKPTIEAQKQKNRSVSRTEDLLLEGMGLFSPSTERDYNPQTQAGPTSLEGRKGKVAFEESSPKKFLSRTDGPAGAQAAGRRENETGTSSAGGKETSPSGVGKREREVVSATGPSERLPQEIIDLRTLLTKEQIDVLESLMQVLNVGFDATLNFVKNQGRGVPGLKQFPFFHPLQQKVMNMYYRASANRDAEKQILEQNERQEAEQKAMRARAESEQQFWAAMQQEALRQGIDPRVVVAHMLQTALQNPQTPAPAGAPNSLATLSRGLHTNALPSRVGGAHAVEFPLRSLVGAATPLQGKRSRLLTSKAPRLLAKNRALSSRAPLGALKELSEGKAEDETPGENKTVRKSELHQKREGGKGPIERGDANGKENEGRVDKKDTEVDLLPHDKAASVPTVETSEDRSEVRVHSDAPASTDKGSPSSSAEQEETEPTGSPAGTPSWQAAPAGAGSSPRHLASMPLPLSGLQAFPFSAPSSPKPFSPPSTFVLPPVISLPSSAGVSVAPTALDQLLSLMGVPENCLLENFRYRGLANVVDRRSSLSTCQAACRAAAAAISGSALTEGDFASAQNPQQQKPSSSAQAPPCGFISFLPEVELCYRYATVEGLLPAPGYVSAPISCSIVETGQFGRQDEKRAAEALLLSGFQSEEQLRDREAQETTERQELRERERRSGSKEETKEQGQGASSANRRNPNGFASAALEHGPQQGETPFSGDVQETKYPPRREKQERSRAAEGPSQERRTPPRLPTEQASRSDGTDSNAVNARPPLSSSPAAAASPSFSPSGEAMSRQKENSAQNSPRKGFAWDGRRGNGEESALAFSGSGPLSRASDVSSDGAETSLVVSAPSTSQTHFYSPSLAKHQAAEEAFSLQSGQVPNESSASSLSQSWYSATKPGTPTDSQAVPSSPSFSSPSVSPSLRSPLSHPSSFSSPAPSTFSFLAPSPEAPTQQPASPVPPRLAALPQPFASPQAPSVSPLTLSSPGASHASPESPERLPDADESFVSVAYSPATGSGLNDTLYPPLSPAATPSAANGSPSAYAGPFLTGAAASPQGGGFLPPSYPPSYSPPSFSPQSVPPAFPPGYASAPTLTAFSALAPLPTITTPVATTAGSLLQTTQGLMQAGNALMQAFPLQQLLDAGQQLYASGFFRNRGMKHLQIPMLGPQKQELPPPPGMEKPTVNCASEGMTCCVPENAAEKWKERPPYLNNHEKQKKCRAHFVTMLNSLCATTSYALKGDAVREKYASGVSSASLAEDEEDNCGLVLTETRDFWIFRHTLVIPGKTMNNAICECKEPKKANEEGLRQIEAFATWEFSLQAVHAMEQQAERGEQIAKGLGTALALTTMLGQQGEEAIGHVLEHASSRGVRK
ncbi:conserved hypothetical protein [Neospora caninum Liverpool]|uniref:Uncharacterized protein n=1 Tax=Neospora caninum (strain Liverpool) TaxID=572307 RepID=F0V761_NEOCL|nr:conserved hypothetical protein [Neospora caninum Liverpool]CBZ49552.1 conserved hypothetical protein [Neospora caninum Liverpool]|eukprot:XP_003879587.1 conserved hypothetical protein [Neospora caninum Liverpool]